MVLDPDLQSLLLPNESPEELENLNSAWVQNFPGDSFLQTTLRNDLVQTDWLRRRARNIFNQIQRDLYLTCLPFEYWKRLVQKHFQFFEKHAQRAQNEFRKALQFLIKTQPQAKSQKSTGEKPEPIDETPDLIGQLTFYQDIYIDFKDGRWVHEFNPPSENVLDHGYRPKLWDVERNFIFKGDQVPEGFEFINIHKGQRYPIGRVSVVYKIEEFERMLEIEAQTGKIIDGERFKYIRHDDAQPTNNLSETSNSQEQSNEEK